MSKPSNFYSTNMYTGSTKKYFYRQLHKQQISRRNENLRNTRPFPINETKVVWRWFHRQKEALVFSSDIPLAFVVGFEIANSKRKFLVTTVERFWERYFVMKPSERHFYEIITQDRPCRLYFDIEFYKEFNPLLNGTQTLEIFIRFVCCCLYTKFGVVVLPQHIVDLDSSTSAKFSRHLIFHINSNTLFENNTSCGLFVKDICACLKSYVECEKNNAYFPLAAPTGDMCLPTLDELRELFVRNKKGCDVICDLSVYTRNRNFRIYLSSKVLKNVPLVISEENRFEFRKKCLGGEHLWCQPDQQDINFSIFKNTLVCPGQRSNNRFLSAGNDAVVSSLHQSKLLSDNVAEGYKCSSYPMLDQFVLKEANKNGTKGEIRRWFHYRNNKTMIYDLHNNRWCGNIQREHKSNHVYYVADLMSCVLYQKCHDSECSAYKSASVDIPLDVLQNDDIEKFDVSIDEDLIEIFSEDICLDL